MQGFKLQNCTQLYQRRNNDSTQVTEVKQRRACPVALLMTD